MEKKEEKKGKKGRKKRRKKDLYNEYAIFCCVFYGVLLLNGDGASRCVSSREGSSKYSCVVFAEEQVCTLTAAAYAFDSTWTV